MAMLPPDIAAQMEALQHVANNRTSRPFDLGGGPPNINQSNSFNLGGVPPSGPGAPPNMEANVMSNVSNHPIMQPANFQKFLHGLSQVHGRHSKWLPFAVTGFPGAEPHPVWSNLLIPGMNTGFIRIAGKDVSIQRMFQVVAQFGGSQQVNSRNQWPNVAQALELPLQSPELLPQNGTHNTADAVSQIYTQLLVPMEEAMSSQLRMAATRQKMMQQGMVAPGMPGVPGASGMIVPPTQTPTMNGAPSFTPGMPGSAVVAPPNPTALDPSSPLKTDPGAGMNGLKRKLDQLQEDQAKRQKIEPIEAVLPNGTTPDAAAVQVPSRHKITYVPLAREVESMGGHNLQEIAMTLQQPRPLRDANDWGTLEIDALTLSIRSRLPIELSYALTATSVLSTTRQTQDNRDRGFPLQKAPDFFEEILDLLEETAFPEGEAISPPDLDGPIASNKQLVDDIFERESRMFASLAPKDPPRERTLTAPPSHIIITLTNCIRNFAASEENAQYIVHQARVLPILLRICRLIKGENGQWRPVSPVLSMTEVIALRKDTLYILSFTVEYIRLSREGEEPNEEMVQVVSEAVNLLSSYIIDPDESLSPFATIQIADKPVPTLSRPPALAELAVETFNRLTHLDANRAVLSKIICEDRLFSLLHSIVHRLPVLEVDFRLLSQTADWLIFVERLLLSLYSIGFMASPTFKRKVKKDKQIRLASILGRLISRFSATPELRNNHAVAIRRTVETMKLFDDAADCFDTSKSPTAPSLSFGMGYGEGNNANVELGVGCYASKRDWALGLLIQQEFNQDGDVFKELESLARVQI